MKKILFLALAALATLQASAQWRIGVNVGGMYNHYVIDKHYFDDYQYKDRWGVGFGLMGQYDILDWLGVRAELLAVARDGIFRFWRHEAARLLPRRCLWRLLAQ